MPESQEEAGCDRPVSEVPAPPPPPSSPSQPEAPPMQQVKVGKPAPEFAAPAYLNGGFTRVSLAEKRGRWLLVCFYPGDFTFV
ncbi:MAG: redoxin domain-containing protein [Deltaproteobacteria bacterium]|nr:redoxin domain-containing protein [Deltaproteobacteria bacterium]